MLDVSEYGLDDLFAQSISGSSPNAADLASHRLHQRFTFERAFGGPVGLIVADTARGQIGGDPPFGHGGEIGLAGKAGIARHFTRLAAETGAVLIHQRDQSCEVGRVGGELLGDNDLMRRIDRDLAAIAGDEAAAARHDPTVVIGEEENRAGRAAGADGMAGGPPNAS